MKQVTQKDFINFIKEKQENATNNEEQLRKLATSRDDLDTANKWWGVASAYQHILCYLNEVEIVPERNDELDALHYAAKGLTYLPKKEPQKNDKLKEFEEKVIIEPFVEELKKIDPSKIPITPYIEPKVELLRNDRFREVESTAANKFCVDAKEIKSIALTYYSVLKEYSVYVMGEGIENATRFSNENEAIAYYDELVEWWKYWKQM